MLQIEKDWFVNQLQDGRKIYNEYGVPSTPSFTPAAVLLPIVERESLSLLLTKRAAHLRHHGGQISFPGGRCESSDKDSKDTAIRETYEEIGLEFEHINIVAELPKYNTITAFEITPFIGMITPSFTIHVDPNEVAEVFEVPLGFVLDKQNHKIEHYLYKGERRPNIVIEFEQYKIWGATAAMIRMLSNHLYP